jgi:hypothetical protein
MTPRQQLARNILGVTMLATLTKFGGLNALACASRPVLASVACNSTRVMTCRAVRSLSTRPQLKTPLSMPADLLPQLVEGVWRRPRLSARRAADFRKKAMLSGKVKEGANPAGVVQRREFVGQTPVLFWRDGSAVLSVNTEGEWDPAWDVLKTPRIMKTPKGIGHDRTQASR